MSSINKTEIDTESVFKQNFDIDNLQITSTSESMKEKLNKQVNQNHRYMTNKMPIPIYQPKMNINRSFLSDELNS